MLDALEPHSAGAGSEIFDDGFEAETDVFAHRLTVPPLKAAIRSRWKWGGSGGRLEATW